MRGKTEERLEQHPPNASEVVAADVIRHRHLAIAEQEIAAVDALRGKIDVETNWSRWELTPSIVETAVQRL